MNTQPGKAQLRTQEQARWAYEVVQELLKDKAKVKEMKSYLRKLPSHLQSSGLAQTLLFYAKKYPEIARRLSKRLVDTDDVAAGVKSLAQKDASFYRVKAREAMSLAGWLKRFAEAMIED